MDEGSSFSAARRRRRVPSRDVTISELTGEGERVAVLCTVVSFDSGRLEGIVDDGTGTARVVLDDVLFAERMLEGSLVRLLGRAYKSDDAIIIRAEIVQPMDGVDPALYRRVRELERRVYNESGF